MRLEDACLLIADCPHTTAPDEGAGYPLVRTPNVGFGRLVYDSMHRVSEEVYLGRNRRATPQAGDLIYAREAPAGNVAVIRSGERVCLGQRTVLLRPNSRIVDSNYLAYYLLAPENRHRLVSQASGATVVHVNIPVIRDLPVVFPNLKKQQKTAAILNDLYSAIDNARRQIALLEEAAMRLYREWFVVNADPKWEKRQLWDVCDYFRGVSYTSKEIEGKDGVPLITLKNIERFGGFREDRSKTFSGVCKDGSSAGANDVLMAVTDMTKERRLVGHVAMVPDTYDKAQFSMDLIRLKGKLVSDSFLYAMLRYSTYADEFAVRASGANVLHLKPSSLDDCEVVVPKRVLCEKFDSTFVPMVQKKNALYRAILRSTEARNRLLPKLMSGEVEV